MSIFTRQFSSALFLSVSILAGCGGSSEVPNPAFGSGVPQSAPNPGGGLPQTEPNNEPILNLLDIAAVREIAVDPGSNLWNLANGQSFPLTPPGTGNSKGRLMQ